MVGSLCNSPHATYCAVQISLWNGSSSDNFSGLPSAASKQKWCHEIGPRRTPGHFREIALRQGVSRSGFAKRVVASNRSYAIFIALSRYSVIAKDIEDFLVLLGRIELPTSSLPMTGISSISAGYSLLEAAEVLRFSAALANAPTGRVFN